MCLSCWKQYGSHQMDTPEVRAAADAIRALYEESMVGGTLYIVVDDWNIDDDDLDWCPGGGGEVKTRPSDRPRTGRSASHRHNGDLNA